AGGGRSAAGGGEVLVVGGVGPAAAPVPADGGERVVHRGAGAGHAGADVPAVEVVAPGGRGDAAALGGGGLDPVDVDGLAVAVHRPLGRPGRDGEPAVERGGVVCGHRRVVARTERIDRVHPADGEPGVEETVERVDDRVDHARVHDQRADVRMAVEVDVA